MCNKDGYYHARIMRYKSKKKHVSPWIDASSGKQLTIPYPNSYFETKKLNCCLQLLCICSHLLPCLFHLGHFWRVPLPSKVTGHHTLTVALRFAQHAPQIRALLKDVVHPPVNLDLHLLSPFSMAWFLVLGCGSWCWSGGALSLVAWPSWVLSGNELGSSLRQVLLPSEVLVEALLIRHADLAERAAPVLLQRLLEFGAGGSWDFCSDLPLGSRNSGRRWWFCLQGR